jgi:hypothetical protein
LKQAQEVEDGAGGAEVIAIGLEALGSIPALRARHAAEADHLEPFGEPGHAMGEELAGPGKVEADERIGLAEVGMGGRDEDERTDGLAMVRGETHGDGSAMGVAEDDGAIEVEGVEDVADLLGGGGEAGVDVGATLGLAGAWEIEGDDVLFGLELLHEGDERIGATHEAVEQDERGPILGELPLFEVREAKAIELNGLADHHLWGCTYGIGAANEVGSERVS